MNLKKYLLATLSVLGIGGTAVQAQPVTMLDPRKIGFTMPTVAADDLKFAVPTQKSFEGAPQFHEDEWRQLEFYPATRLTEVQRRLTEYKAFEKQNRIASGWKDIYARRIAGGPLFGPAGTNDLAAFLQGQLKPAPILTTSSSPLGQVKKAFTVRLAGTVFLYGIGNASGITSLAAMVERGGDDQALTAAFTRLNRQYKVVLVDWRGQMLLTSVERDGSLGVWRP